MIFGGAKVQINTGNKPMKKVDLTNKKPGVEHRA